MTLAIMQPYLFPYIGYFQLVAAVDRFVFLDDVAFIKKGWINRNRILVSGKPWTFTVPLRDASQNRPICDTEIHAQEFTPSKLMRTIDLAYRKAPFFASTYALAERVFGGTYQSIAEMAQESVRFVCEYLELSTPFVRSSTCHGPSPLKGAERIREICAHEGATRYLNPSGGTELYEAADFAAQGIELRFLQSREQSYPQWGGPFVPWLSILDVLMFNDPAVVRGMLSAFDLREA
jgi:hypothetical protein